MKHKLCYTMYKIVKVHNSYKFCGIIMKAQQAHLYVMTNNPTNYEPIPSYGFRGVVLIKYHRQMETIRHYYVPPSRGCGGQT